MEWPTEEIYGAYLDRFNLEDQFKRGKSPHQAAMMPSSHRTDNMLRIFYFTCVVALSYMRLLEIHLTKVGILMTAKHATEIMKTLHTTFVWMKGAKNPERMVDIPCSDQKVVLKALGYEHNDGSVLPIR
jgi:hypothetical protein